MVKSLLVAVLFLAVLGMPVRTAQEPMSLRGLIVLIDFPDHPGAIPVSRANSIVNGDGYTEPSVTSSLRDYWRAQSRGHVDFTNTVVGYYRAPQPAPWYDTQPFATVKALYSDALDWVVATHPDFNWNGLSLANGPMNRSGIEEGTFLSIAFMTTAWIAGTGGTHFLPPWTAPNGVQAQQVCAATFMAPWDTNINLFWLTHEMGHTVWGWPDTYDNFAASHGTGIYSLMSGNQGTGDIEPVGGPFLAAEAWVKVVDIRQQRTIVMEPDGDVVARLQNPFDPHEYFVIEARQQATTGNDAFPVPRGLLIWHVDDNVTTSNTRPQMTPAEHYRISVEQADGLFDLEHLVNPGDSGDVFVPGTEFSPSFQPDSNWWSGAPSGLTIGDIRFLNNGRIQFRALTR